MTTPVQNEDVADIAHRPQFDTFDCSSCAMPWPCAPGRSELLATMPDRIQLSIYMWNVLEQAAAVLRDQPPSVLFDRFLGWTQ